MAHASSGKRPDPNRPVRLRDIAELAGVHMTAVSAVLRGSTRTRTRVSEETARRIRELAEQLNYRPNLGAQTMRGSKTKLIGLLEFGYSEASMRRTSDLAVELRQRGYRVMSHNALWYPSVSEAMNVFMDARVEGVILVMLQAGVGPEALEPIRRMGVPCVAFNGAHLPGLPQVRSDILSCVRELTGHLIHRGRRRRLALLTPHIRHREEAERYWPTHERMEGFSAVIREAGGAVEEETLAFPETAPDRPAGLIVVENPWQGSTHADLGYRAAKRLFEAGTRPDALVCTSDRFAFGAMRACFEAGITIPEPMAIVGVNNEADTHYYCPALTTVDTLHQEASIQAVDLLFAILRGEIAPDAPIIQKVPGRLVVRESCGAGRKP